MKKFISILVVLILIIILINIDIPKKIEEYKEHKKNEFYKKEENKLISIIKNNKYNELMKISKTDNRNLTKEEAIAFIKAIKTNGTDFYSLFETLKQQEGKNKKAKQIYNKDLAFTVIQKKNKFEYIVPQYEVKTDFLEDETEKSIKLGELDKDYTVSYKYGDKIKSVKHNRLEEASYGKFSYGIYDIDAIKTEESGDKQKGKIKIEALYNNSVAKEEFVKQYISLSLDDDTRELTDVEITLYMNGKKYEGLKDGDYVAYMNKEEFRDAYVKLNLYGRNITSLTTNYLEEYSNSDSYFTLIFEETDYDYINSFEEKRIQDRLNSLSEEEKAEYSDEAERRMNGGYTDEELEEMEN